MNREELKACALSLPLVPGVYLMKDSKDTVIYVGKAKKLKNRVVQYFRDTGSHSPKTLKMVSQVDHFETIAAPTEFEALVLECSLIKHYQPKYNILLKDDKGYPYIRLDLRESYPRMSLATRVVTDGAKYFGPYGSRGRSQQIIDSLYKIFRLPLCSKRFPADIGKARPCLNHQMKLCDAWCTDCALQQEYQNRIRQAVSLLEGKGQQLCDSLRRDMEQAAQELNFELAAQYRDKLRSIEALSRQQLMTAGRAVDTDVIGIHETEAKVCIAVLHYVGGDLMDKEYSLFPASTEPAELLSAFVKQYYLSRKELPKAIFLPVEIEDRELFAQLLSQQYGRKLRITVPQRAEPRKLLELACANAREEAERATDAAERLSGTLRLLQSLLGLPQPPLRLEAYDISNTAGTDIVASMTVFEEGKPKKSDYKRFKLRGMEDQDDYGSMRQVLCRRFCHYLDGDKGFDKRPDALLIDGGQNHAAIVAEALLQMGIELPIYGMVKDHRHRTRALITPQGQEIGIAHHPAVFSFIGRIQEETHRFAITYHRQLRSKRVKGSRLDAIEGVGEKRRNRLLKDFKSITAISQASVEELCSSVPRSVALAVYKHFHPSEQEEATCES